MKYRDAHTRAGPQIARGGAADTCGGECDRVKDVGVCLVLVLVCLSGEIPCGEHTGKRDRERDAVWDVVELAIYIVSSGAGCMLMMCVCARSPRSLVALLRENKMYKQ